MLVSFCCCDKTPEKVILKEESYFGLWFQSMVTWLHVSGPCVRQHIKVEGHGEGKLIILQ
jgi:hypothetical protein